MPFGFRNGAQTFQRLIDDILSGLVYVFAYVDDILSASKSLEEHKSYLTEVFARLSEYG